jgi:hypothetical protein
MTITPADIVELHTVKPAEVKEWFECHREPWPNDAAYVGIAALLSRMRWGNDPPRYSPDRPEREDPRWSAEQVADAAKLLHAMAPEMLKYWENVRPSPERNAAYDAMLVFRDAIMGALPYIECLGQRYAKTKAKNWGVWHMQAIIIAYYVRQALIKSGHDAPRLSQNAPTIKIVHKALARTKFVVKRPALAAYLCRREEVLKKQAEKQAEAMGMSLDQVTKQMAIVKQHADELMKQRPEDFDPLWVRLGNI